MQSKFNSSRLMPFAFSWRASFSLLIAFGIGVVALRTAAIAQPVRDEVVDTALILAVDTSGSVSEERFRLQMDGIATALEDVGVINTILGGPRGAISLMLVTWADRSQIALPWTLVRSKQEAIAAAQKIRALPRFSGEYTCMGKMFLALKETVLGSVPYSPLKTVIDVSGDGIDNCGNSESLGSIKEDVVAKGVVINGLPIVVDQTELVGQGAYQAPGSGFELLTPPDQRPRQTLQQWYEAEVIGGFGAFTIPAYGYADFARAMRSKFVVEISWSSEPDTVRTVKPFRSLAFGR